jgi:hypothetical protein
MKLRRRPDEKPPGYDGDHADKLSRIPALRHYEDERSRREDRKYGQTSFTRPPVPLPLSSGTAGTGRAARPLTAGCTSRRSTLSRSRGVLLWWLRSFAGLCVTV